MMQMCRIGQTSAESSWESAASLPSDLIQEYEDGLQRGLSFNFQ